MKKTVYFAVAVLLAATVLSIRSNSFSRATELGQRLIIEAIGIDLDEGKTRLTVQALDAASAGSGSNGESGDPKTRIYVFEGRTSGEAFSGAATATGLVPLYSQARALILGEELIKKDVGAALDFFLREYNTRTDILVCAAKGRAEDAVRANLCDGKADAVALEETLEAGEEKGLCSAVPLYKFVTLFLNEEDSAFCPVIEIKKSDGEDFDLARISGAVFFRGGKAVFYADEETMTGISLLKNRKPKPVISVSAEGCDFSVNTVSAETKIKLSRDRESFVFKICCAVKCDITEVSGNDAAELDAALAEKAAEAAGEKLKKLMDNSLKRLFFEKELDVCRFFRLVNLKYPRSADAYKLSRFSEESTRVFTEVALTLRRTGKESLQSPGK